MVRLYFIKSPFRPSVASYNLNRKPNNNNRGEEVKMESKEHSSFQKVHSIVPFFPWLRHRRVVIVCRWLGAYSSTARHRQAPTTTGQQRKRNRCKMKMLSSSSRRDGDVVVVRSFAMPKHHQPAAGVVIGIPASFPPYCGPLAVAIVALVRLFWVASRPPHRGISQQRYPASAIGYKALLSVSHRDLFSLMSISFGSARRSNIMHAQKININVMLFSSAFLFCVKL